jgi:hypothetical protein
MTRAEAIAKITTSLSRLSDEHLQALAEIALSWSDAKLPPEDEVTRTAIGNGIAQGRRGEFASDEEVAAAYARFRK